MNKQGLIEDALRATHAVANLHVESMPSSRTPWHDAVVTLMLSNARNETFDVEVKTVVDRLETLRILKQHATQLERRPLLVTSYLSTFLAEECRNLGLNFIDTAGNALIDVPGHFVFVVGKPRLSPFPTHSKNHALRTSNGLRIVFALLTEPELLNRSQRDIAQYARVALGSVGKTLDDLVRQGHLNTTDSRSRRLLAHDELARDWSRQYPISLRGKLNPRRYSTTGRQWKEIALLPDQAVWGGEPAASQLDGYLQSAEATIYTWMPRERFLMEHRLRPDAGGDIEILDAFWESPDPNASARNSALAPALLVYADLISSHDGRNREAAAKLWGQIQHDV